MEIAHARAMEVKSAAGSTTKRRKLDSGELLQSSSSNFDVANECSCLMNSPENSVSLVTTSGTSDQIPANFAANNEFFNNSSRSSDLKAENFGTDDSTFKIIDGFSREATPSEYSEVMESRKTKNKAPPAIRPSMAEIEEFFSVAEKYEARRFAEKYNYDIVKDVPLEGRYQWVRIKQ